MLLATQFFVYKYEVPLTCSYTPLCETEPCVFLSSPSYSSLVCCLSVVCALARRSLLLLPRVSQLICVALSCCQDVQCVGTFVVSVSTCIVDRISFGMVGYADSREVGFSHFRQAIPTTILEQFAEDAIKLCGRFLRFSGSKSSAQRVGDG